MFNKTYLSAQEYKFRKDIYYANIGKFPSLQQ